MFPVRFCIGSAALVVSFAAVAACDDVVAAQPCSGIPAGGCPLSRGVACEDPSCEAVYACRPGNVWELQARCPAREGASRDSGATGDVDASAVVDASIDAPPGAFGGPGCAPLQEPDCSLGLALSCGVGCCGCVDLYVCEDQGWSIWGQCVDGAPRPE
ncbi:MAG TPA: hypothetical protein VM580_18240 [Labilithrix sp.]|nr:hypothetical protein [Labilithrix sp.]